jgi:hypothetical protein
LVLRQSLEHHAVWWLPAVPLAYLIGWSVTTAVIRTSVDTDFSVFGASGALVFQALTGMVLWRMGIIERTE